MKQVIDGLLYDTDTATEIYCEVEKRTRYYKTVNNRFFVVYGNNEMQVVSEEFVKSILGKKDIDKYIEVFGEPMEG